MGALASKPNVARRVLVNDFAQGLDGAEYISIDEDLREWAETTDDNFEVMLQANPVQLDVDGIYDGEPAGFSFGRRVLANPRYAKWNVMIEEPTAILDATVAGGSYHQKALVVDGQVAFVSGMNVKGADWDDSEHKVFNHRRMAIDASRFDRLDVEAAEMLPDYGPRKDFGIRLEGPAARDVEAILHKRWNLGLDAGDLYAEHASTWNLDPAQEVSGKTVLTQVVATLPPPFHDMSILEAHEKAIRNAETYIYIEDQYFRAPRVLNAIVERMLAVPDLVLIVVTKPVADWDPGAKYSYLGDSTLRDLFPDRYILLQLQTFDVVFDEGWFFNQLSFYLEPIDTHSKLRLVDDKYLSVGSCNFNNRGYLYEGEMNVEVLDHGFATDARRDIFSNLVGPDWAHLVSDDAIANLELLATVAASNQAHLDWWEENVDLVDVDMIDNALDVHTPSGFVYPLEFSYAYWWDVGPDLF